MTAIRYKSMVVTLVANIQKEESAENYYNALNSLTPDQLVDCVIFHENKDIPYLEQEAKNTILLNHVAKLEQQHLNILKAFCKSYKNINPLQEKILDIVNSRLEYLYLNEKLPQTSLKNTTINKI